MIDFIEDSTASIEERFARARPSGSLLESRQSIRSRGSVNYDLEPKHQQLIDLTFQSSSTPLCDCYVHTDRNGSIPILSMPLVAFPLPMPHLVAHAKVYWTSPHPLTPVQRPLRGTVILAPDSSLFTSTNAHPASYQSTFSGNLPQQSFTTTSLFQQE